MRYESRQNSTRAIHDMIWQAISMRTDKIGAQTVDEPELIPVEEGYSDALLGKEFAAMKYLQQALDIAQEYEFSHIAQEFRSIASQLPWSQNPKYSETVGGLELLNGYAYASLSGPEGPMPCISPRGGFYLMAPNVIYPSHNHAPREIYLIMTPGAEWCLDEGEWFSVEPGDLILHSPWQMHAMRSRDKPVLAYAAWLEPGNRGDIGWASS